MHNNMCPIGFGDCPDCNHYDHSDGQCNYTEVDIEDFCEMQED